MPTGWGSTATWRNRVKELLQFLLESIENHFRFLVGAPIWVRIKGIPERRLMSQVFVKEIIANLPKNREPYLKSRRGPGK